MGSFFEASALGWWFENRNKEKKMETNTLPFAPRRTWSRQPRRSWKFEKTQRYKKAEFRHISFEECDLETQQPQDDAWYKPRLGNKGGFHYWVRIPPLLEEEEDPYLDDYGPEYQYPDPSNWPCWEKAPACNCWDPNDWICDTCYEQLSQEVKRQLIAGIPPCEWDDASIVAAQELAKKYYERTLGENASDHLVSDQNNNQYWRKIWKRIRADSRSKKSERVSDFDLPPSHRMKMVAGKRATRFQ